MMAAGSRAVKNGRAVAVAALETLISKVFCLRGQQRAAAAAMVGACQKWGKLYGMIWYNEWS
jgi:hypothetical protein